MIVLPATTAIPANPARAAPSTVRGPIEGKSTRRSCPRFAALTNTPCPVAAANSTALAKLGDARKHAVGTFRRLDRQHAGVGHHYGLTHVERTGRVEQSKRRRNVGMVARFGTLAPQRPFRHQDVRRDVVCANQPEAVLFENCRDALEQAIVTAAQEADNSGKQAERFEIRPDFPDRRPHHRADEHHIPAALTLGDPAEPAELPERGPMVGIGSDALRVRPTANGEQHDTASALAHRIRDRKRQCSTAADHGERTIACPLRSIGVAHDTSSDDPRRMAMVSGREPARMKSITLATSGMSPPCAAT